MMVIWSSRSKGSPVVVSLIAEFVALPAVEGRVEGTSRTRAVSRSIMEERSGEGGPDVEADVSMVGTGMVFACLIVGRRKPPVVVGSTGEVGSETAAISSAVGNFQS